MGLYGTYSCKFGQTLVNGQPAHAAGVQRKTIYILLHSMVLGIFGRKKIQICAWSNQMPKPDQMTEIVPYV